MEAPYHDVPHYFHLLHRSGYPGLGSNRSECYNNDRNQDPILTRDSCLIQSNGANLSFPEAFGIADNEWLIGLINGAPYLASAAL